MCHPPARVQQRAADQRHPADGGRAVFSEGLLQRQRDHHHRRHRPFPGESFPRWALIFVWKSESGCLGTFSTDDGDLSVQIFGTHQVIRPRLHHAARMPIPDLIEIAHLKIKHVQMFRAQM